MNNVNIINLADSKSFTYDNIVHPMALKLKLKEGDYIELSYKDLKFVSVSFRFNHPKYTYSCKFYDADFNVLKTETLTHLSFINMIPNIPWEKMVRLHDGSINYSKRIMFETENTKA